MSLGPEDTLMRHVGYMRFSLILFCALGVFIIFLTGYLHEQVHVSIFDNYNITSKVYLFKYFPNMVTQPDAACPDSNCVLANSINEAVGYNTLPFFALFFIGFAIIIGELEYSNILKERMLSS